MVRCIDKAARCAGAAKLKLVLGAHNFRWLNRRASETGPAAVEAVPPGKVPPQKSGDGKTRYVTTAYFSHETGAVGQTKLMESWGWAASFQDFCRHACFVCSC